MTGYVIEPPRQAALPVAGETGMFPVRRVYCIGRNYAAHTVEMGGDPDRAPPFFFQKNPDNLDPSGNFPLPAGRGAVHHEAELAVFLGAGGTDIPVAEALAHVYGYAAALDMTLRDVQAEAKAAGRPWEVAKAFERSAPVGAVHPASDVGHLAEGCIALTVNGATRQEGDLAQMIWKVPEIVASLSSHYRLAAGDVILTGTPAGVGPVAQGDVLALKIAGLAPLNVRVT